MAQLAPAGRTPRSSVVRWTIALASVAETVEELEKPIEYWRVDAFGRLFSMSDLTAQ